MPDVTRVSAALIAKLAADATLMAITPDGVFRDVAASGKTKFVIVSRVTGFRVPMFGGAAFDEALFLVKAVYLSTSATQAVAAAARIDVLLDQQPLTVTGYTHMLTRQVEPLEMTEVDEDNNDIRWQHFGARYEVMVSP